VRSPHGLRRGAQPPAGHRPFESPRPLGATVTCPSEKTSLLREAVRRPREKTSLLREAVDRSCLGMMSRSDILHRPDCLDTNEAKKAMSGS
jgi:hypothetical protein